MVAEQAGTELSSRSHGRRQLGNNSGSVKSTGQVLVNAHTVNVDSDAKAGQMDGFAATYRYLGASCYKLSAPKTEDKRELLDLGKHFKNEGQAMAETNEKLGGFPFVIGGLSFI